MPKLQQFRLDFDRVGATYAPGENVTGRVFLKLSGSKNIREIRIEVRGEAITHWTQTRSQKDSSGRSFSVTDHYKGEEHYFSVTSRLFGSGDGQTTLPAGEHSYHFSFQLPLNVPCSIEHKLGYVRYTIKAILDRPWRFDHKIISGFTVIAPYDLNKYQHLAIGINEEFRRYFRNWCIFSDGGLSVHLKTRVKGFVPGETIDFVVNYDNNSERVDLTQLKLKLEKNLIFHTTAPKDKKISKEIIRKTKQKGPFPKKGEVTLKIEVPPLPPSRLEFCSLIDVEYKLYFKLSVSGLRFPEKKTFPIEIGTVPFYSQVPTMQPSVGNPYAASAPPIDQISPIGILTPQPLAPPIGFVVVGIQPGVSGTPQSYQSIPEMPPPSYEECISGSKTISDQNEQGMYGVNVQFTPRYPVYRSPMPMPYPP